MVVVERPTLRTDDWSEGLCTLNMKSHMSSCDKGWYQIWEQIFSWGRERNLGYSWSWAVLVLNWPIQFSSVTQSCPTLCNPMHCSMPGFPVHHQLLELAQSHVHWVSDAIQPSHPLSSLLLPSIFPSIRSFPMSQFFISGGQSIGTSASASVLPVNIQEWFPLGLTGLLSLQSKGLFTLIDPYYFSSLSLTKIKVMISQKWISTVSLMKGNPWGQWTVLWCYADSLTVGRGTSMIFSYWQTESLPAHHRHFLVWSTQWC